MYRPTISIRAMLCAVACIGLACVALARANSIWATVMFTAALAVISLGLLAAILRAAARSRRIGSALRFSVGCIFGWRIGRATQVGLDRTSLLHGVCSKTKQARWRRRGC